MQDTAIDIRIEPPTTKEHTLRPTDFQYTTLATSPCPSTESDPLVQNHPRYNRPRMSSISFMLDSWFAGGIITRSNYMAQCYNTVWNSDTGVRSLRCLLWNFKIKKNGGEYIALIALGLQWFVPFSPLLLLFDTLNTVRDGNRFKSLVFFFLLLQSISFVWYIVVLHVVISNGKLWQRSWFTFEVPRGTIGLLEVSNDNGLTLFHNGANIRFMKVENHRISQLDYLGKLHQKHLLQNMNERNLNKAEIIIYTDDFLYCYNRWPKMMLAGLLLATICSLISIYYFLGRMKYE